jgi:putative sterol carrier protein
MSLNKFLNDLPEQVLPSMIEGHTTCFHFDISGEGGGQYTISIEDGKMSTSPGLVGDSKCTVTCTYDLLQGLLDKSQNPMMAMFSGKLKISNPGEMLKYAKIFGLM